MEDDDFELWLGGYGAVTRFVVFLQEFGTAQALARSGQLAHVRLALIAADHLADVVLHVHAKRRFAASEQSQMQLRRRFDSLERDKTLGAFNRKLGLAEQDSDDPAWLAVEAIVSPDDAAVMRLAHRYRNGVHHEDRHNPVLLIPLTWLYLAAVGRAFVGQYPRGACQSFESRAQRVALAELGYSTESRRGTLAFQVAAREIIGELTQPIAVGVDRLRETLAADVELRMSDTAGTVKALLDDGMPFERLVFVIRWSQTWRARGADPAAQRLQYRREELGELAHGELDEQQRAALFDEKARVNAELIARWHDIQRTYEPPASLDTMVHMRGAAQRLRRQKRIRALLENYERLDTEISAFEFAVGEAAHAWSVIVEGAADAARDA